MKTNIRKDWGLWSSPSYKWPAVISRIFWNWLSLQYETRFQNNNLIKTLIWQIFLKSCDIKRNISAENVSCIVNSVNFKKFVKSLQVICTRDSAKVLNPSLCLPSSARCTFNLITLTNHRASFHCHFCHLRPVSSFFVV